jgi:hypothetical protein
MAAFLHSSYFCKKCLKGYEHAETHNCNDICKLCCKMDCVINSGDTINCDLYKAKCREQRCYQQHIESVCVKQVLCTKCQRYKVSKFHICEGRWCYNCQKVVDMFRSVLY